MQTKVVGNQHQIFLEGPISEKNEIYDHELKNTPELLINMEKVTFINSIGVKNWITWSMKIPGTCKVQLEKCPYVIVNQVNIVHGFLPRNATVESFMAPFICETCGKEQILLLQRGQHFEYAKSATDPRTVNLPEDLMCAKCNKAMEPDFMVEKIFGFLSPRK